MDEGCGNTKRISGEGPCPVSSKSDILKPRSSNAAITHGGPGQSRGMQRVDDDVMPSAPIQLLPFELLLQMFKLCISNDTPVRDLISLALVCKLWRSIVEGTSSLWCCISGGEAVPHVRKALAMAKDASLEIIYFEDIARTDPEIFFGEIGRLITQWESLSITTGNSNSPVTALQTNPPPNLKTLHLRAPWYWEWKKGPVTLFEGEPAPLALTDLWVDQIPVVMEPLRLSGLRSLELNRTPVVSAGELLRVLRDSPALERCGLYDLTSLKEFPLPGPEKELLRFQGVENPNIRLSDLRTLALCGLPVSFVHLVLSAIQIPNLQRLDMDCKIDQHGQSPASDLFTTHISHHSPTFTALTDSAKNIQIISFSDTNWTISVGNLIITLEGLAFKLKHLDEGLEWLFSHLGGHVDTLPVNLSLHELEISSKWFTRLASALKVTKLELWTASSSEHEPERQPRNIISLLSQPLESTPTQQWVLPDLESLNTNVVHEDGKSKILDMVKARHAFIETQLDGTQEADVVLKPFKEIRLRGGRNGISKDLAPNTKFLVALQKAARGAEIWWEEFKWTGSEDLNAATKSNEAGSGRVVAG